MLSAYGCRAGQARDALTTINESPAPYIGWSAQVGYGPTEREPYRRTGERRIPDSAPTDYATLPAGAVQVLHDLGLPVE